MAKEPKKPNQGWTRTRNYPPEVREAAIAALCFVHSVRKEPEQPSICGLWDYWKIVGPMEPLSDRECHHVRTEFQKLHNVMEACQTIWTEEQLNVIEYTAKELLCMGTTPWLEAFPNDTMELNGMQKNILQKLKHNGCMTGPALLTALRCTRETLWGKNGKGGADGPAIASKDPKLGYCLTDECPE